ncbi:hypothetical protein COMNV_00090 [Commensalibacter sp. Nvir]|nr:hypothetical protein COMNV_00090 [Commensalibacter sp. Nvir]
MRLYNKYTNGERKGIYDKIKALRNQRLAHAFIGEKLSAQHSLKEFQSLYNDLLERYAMACSLFEIGYNFIKTK